MIRIIIAVLLLSVPNSTNFNLYGNIDEETVLPIAVALDEITSGTVTININSPGGSVSDGYKLILAIEAAQSRGVVVICRGEDRVASMAYSIFQACNQRLGSNNTRFVIHNLWVVLNFPLRPEEVVSIGKNLVEENDRLLSYQIRRSALTLDFVKSIIGNGSGTFEPDCQISLKLGLLDRCD